MAKAGGCGSHGVAPGPAASYLQETVEHANFLPHPRCNKSEAEGGAVLRNQCFNKLFGCSDECSTLRNTDLNFQVS